MEPAFYQIASTYEQHPRSQRPSKNLAGETPIAIRG